ncbi:MAG: hypothetical protein K2X35_04680 [Bryobacteraceae bacterium]|nr:hypothetical protein [Bryobacteraceae bacterium]
MAWLWSSDQEYAEMVQPVRLNQGNLVRRTLKETLFSAQSHLHAAAAKLEHGIMALRSFPLEPVRPPEELQDLSEALLLVEDIVVDGEQLLLYHKRLALSEHSSGFLNSHDLPDHWQRSGRCVSLRKPSSSVAIASTAARYTAIVLFGTYTGAWSNNIAYSGTAAVNSFQGFGHYIVGNQILQNRYEIFDGTGQGQIYLSGGASTVSVAGNVINGNYWRTNGQPVNGCSTQNNVQPYPMGIEAFGTGHRFYNNWILQHLGWGILVRQSSGVLVSTDNPWVPGSPRQYIENNGGCVSLGCYLGFPQALAMAQINVNNYDGPVSNVTF